MLIVSMVWQRKLCNITIATQCDALFKSSEVVHGFIAAPHSNLKFASLYKSILVRRIVLQSGIKIGKCLFQFLLSEKHSEALVVVAVVLRLQSNNFLP